MKYNDRSSFFEPIEQALDRAGGEWPVRVVLAPKGYKGEAVVVIGQDDREFETGWQGADETRFPARIRAAATVLRRRGMFGRFRIWHDDGVLVIERTDRLSLS